VYALIVVLFGVWLIGVSTSYMFGGFIHLFLGVAVAALLRVLQARQPVRD